jgi:plastocyanin
MTAPRKAIALIATCGALGGAVGCGGDEDSGAGATPADSGSVAVDISDFKYDPDAVVVDAGTKVTWTNSDSAPHTATADDSSFDTGDLDRGDSAAVTLDEAGTFSYFCRFHPFMKATVEVQ